MPASCLLALALATALLAGCLAGVPDEQADSAATASGGPPDAQASSGGPVRAAAARAAGNATTNGSLLAHEVYEGYFTFILNGVYNPQDPAFFPTTFPEGYAFAVVEMAWPTPTAGGGDLSLMVHEVGMGGPDGMLAEVDGPGPLRLDLAPADVAPGEYWLVGYVPRDGRTPVVVDQAFEIHVSYFDGPPPEGYSALAG